MLSNSGNSESYAKFIRMAEDNAAIRCVSVSISVACDRYSVKSGTGISDPVVMVPNIGLGHGNTRRRFSGNGPDWSISPSPHGSPMK